MRRTIFAVLVLVNVGFFIWGVFYLSAEQSNAPQAEPSVAPEKMRKLDKKDISRARARAPRNSDAENKLSLASAQTENKTPSPAVCYRLGPLSSDEQFRRVQEGIVGLPFARREEKARMVVGYRVYLPSFPSKEAAEQKRRELTQLGVKDHSLLQEDGQRNAVSLGLFSLEENAHARIKALAEKGVEAKLHAVEQERPGQWLDVGPTAPTPELRGRLSGLIDGVSGAGVRDIPCAASAPAVPTDSR